MTKADIVNEVSRKTGISRDEVLRTLESFMDTVKNSLGKGENVYMRTFGSFIVKPLVILLKTPQSKFLPTKSLRLNLRKNFRQW